jgi:Zn-dependent protease
MLRFGNFNLLELATRMLALLISFTIHEFSHGYSAYLLGDHTAKRDGRLSLNPLKHIDPVGFILLMLVGFGWAKPVMVDPRRLKNPKGDLAIISFCGPASNFLLAFVFAMAYVPVATFGRGTFFEILTMFLMQGFTMNIALGVFNMLPIPPLDGLKVYASALPDDLYFKVMNFGSRAGTYIFLILAFTGILGRVLSPLSGAVMQAYAALVTKIYSVIFPALQG